MQDTNWKLNCLFEPMEGLTAFADLTRALEKPGVTSAYGPDDSQRAHLLAAAALKLDRPLLVIEPNDVAAARMAEDLNVLLSGGAKLLPARDITFLKTAASSRELSMRRIEALGDCLSGRVKALVTPADAMLFRLAPAAEFEGRIIDIAEGAQTEPAELMARLTLAGYERVQLVEARGQCALRGGILDVYPVGGPSALRVEFFDDEVDSIRTFDVMTQRSISRRPAVRLYPAQEIPLDAGARARASEALEAMLENFDDSTGRDRQASIEKEFDLIPFEEFLRLSAEAEAEDGDAPRKKGGKRGVVALPKMVTLGSAVKRNFGSVLEALKNGLTPDGGDSCRCCWTTGTPRRTTWTTPWWCSTSPSACGSAVKTAFWSSGSATSPRWSARRRCPARRRSWSAMTNCWPGCRTGVYCSPTPSCAPSRTSNPRR